MNRFLTKSICLLLLLAAVSKLWGHNIAVTNAGIVTANVSGQYAMIGFDIGWENSWRDVSNWDAAWVFVKYRPVGSTGAWSHATLNHVNGTSDGHLAAAGATITTPSDGKGVFIYRDAIGSGTTSFVGNRLRWNFGVDGLAMGTAVDIKVLAIEMVYVPSGSFYVGDGETNAGDLYGQLEAGVTGTPFQLTSEGAIVLGGGGNGSLGNNDRVGEYGDAACPTCFNCTGDGCLGGSGDDFSDATSQNLPAAFPKGFNAFYCMKYELTQQSIVDMVNMCTVAQQNFMLDQAHFYLGNGSPPSNRWGFVDNLGVWSTVEPYAPIIYFDWQRGAAYADWSGLRPMTELEFEKASRGTGVPVLRDYPWGDNTIDLSINLTLSNQGQPDEGVATGYNASGTTGNCWIRGGAHSMQVVGRTGIFAAHPSNTGRISAGASPYGIHELGGNAWERAVSIGHPEGRKFTGLHGDGVIDAAGYADVPNWPGTFAGTTVASNIGVGYRGGGLAYPGPNIERNARVSSRRVASAYWNAVIQDDGTRFVRTAQ